MTPLTHHEILGLVAPFARRGRHVDLAASNRLGRQLLFKPAVHRIATLPGGDVRETVQLEDLGGSYRLTRVLAPASGPEARLCAEGVDPGVLLEHVEAVPVERHFLCNDGFVIANSFRIDMTARHLVLMAAEVRFDGLTLKLDATSVGGTPADAEISPAPGAAFELPQDLVAVLGWQWTRLRERDHGWDCRLRMRGREPARSIHTERAVEAAARHIARTLAEPPARYHQRLAAARWGVFLRRAMPLAICIAVIVAAALVPRLHLSEGSGLRALIFNAPPVLMMLFFCLHEVPTIEIPPVPRCRDGASWRKVASA